MILLIVVFMAWPNFPFAGADLTSRVILTLPLLLLAPGLVMGNRIAPGLTGFLSIAFLAHGVTEIIANPVVRIPAALEIFLAFLILIGVATDLRMRRRVRVEGAPHE